MSKTDYRGIWVFAEQEGGVLEPTVFELLAKARELKAHNGEQISAVLLGSGVDDGVLVVVEESEEPVKMDIHRGGLNHLWIPRCHVDAAGFGILANITIRKKHDLIFA